MKTTAILLAAALTVSCSGRKNEQNATGQTGENDTQLTSTANDTANGCQGTYKGTIPAADCPGINITLTLGNDGTFDETYEYIERETFTETGTYRVEGNILTTVSATNDTTYYKTAGDTLKMLDRDLNPSGGETAGIYILLKQQQPAQVLSKKSTHSDK